MPLHFFHSRAALDLDRLIQLWRQLSKVCSAAAWCGSMAASVRAGRWFTSGPRKAANAGVKSLHQESRCNATRRPSSWATPCRPSPLLVQARRVCSAVAGGRPHPRGRWSGAPATVTHLADKLSGLLLGLQWSCALTVVADAYYAAPKFRPLACWPTVTIWVHPCRSNAVAISHRPGPRSASGGRGDAEYYGPRPNSGTGSGLPQSCSSKALSPVYGESAHHYAAHIYSYELAVAFRWVS